MHEVFTTGPRVRSVYRDFRLNAPYYREEHTPTAEACVALCRGEPAARDCGGMAFKEKAAPSGPIFPPGINCTVGNTCCYLMSHLSIGPEPQSDCALPCVGWDSWARDALPLPNSSPLASERAPEAWSVQTWDFERTPRCFVFNACAVIFTTPCLSPFVRLMLGSSTALALAVYRRIRLNRTGRTFQGSVLGVTLAWPGGSSQRSRHWALVQAWCGSSPSAVLFQTPRDNG